VKRSSYGERDYAFGQLMLTLRMGIGLTQAGLAHRLRVSRHTVGEWEGGLSYPKADHLKAFVALGVELRAFTDGCEAEEIRALWKAAHQKVLLDERWLQGLLGTQRPPLVLVAPPSDKQTAIDEQAVAQPALGPRVDWGDARWMCPPSMGARGNWRS
jgi:transcriptional regulator with XRE-family HTH domain